MKFGLSIVLEKNQTCQGAGISSNASTICHPRRTVQTRSLHKGVSPQAGLSDIGCPGHNLVQS